MKIEKDIKEFKLSEKYKKTKTEQEREKIVN